MEESNAEQKVIDAILPEDCLGFLLEYFMNGLFSVCGYQLRV